MPNKLDKIWERDGRKCWICVLLYGHKDSRIIVKRQDASIDHIIPKSKREELGMSWKEMNGWDNLRLAHKLCNSKRGVQSEEDLMNVVDWHKHPAHHNQHQKYVNKPKGLRH